MALSEEFVQSGQWLFHRRGYLPAVLSLLVLSEVGPVGEGQQGVPLAWPLICFLISLSGFALRIYTVGYAAPKSSGRGRVIELTDQLNTTGAYSVVRHPLYLANALMWLGPTLVPRVWWLVVVVGLICWLAYERIMFAEEDYLRATFGEPYLEWDQRTPAFLPAFRHWHPPARPFNPRAILRREYSGLFQLVLMFAALNAAQWRATTGHWEISPFWLNTLLIGGVLAGVLRLLWKRSRLLHDQATASQ